MRLGEIKITKQPENGLNLCICNLTTSEEDLTKTSASASPTSAMSTASSADLAEMGKVMVEDGDGEEAIRLFREALYKAEMDASTSSDPSIAKAQIQLGTALREAAKHQEALELSRRAVNIYRSVEYDFVAKPFADVAQCIISGKVESGSLFILYTC